MSTNVVVRDFRQADVAAANALTNRYIRETPIHFAYTPAGNAEFEAYWRDGAGRYPWLAAECAGRFAGYAKASLWREREAYRFTAECGLYVEPEFHRKGVGRALYGVLFERLASAGIHTLIAGITLPNEPSVRMHEALGFERVATFRQVGWKFEQWHDVGFWQRMV
ncbi:Phosphinothricin N-acetyltransferase [Phycisphaerae bacterium RAS1]|nr:Phosphinothricin N-acetyltransferase [Phycisphaerae bacterium RAS1]